MEPSGRNQWQSVANGRARKRLEQAKTVATGCDQLPIGAHGKEGVDGSSPSEGSAKALEYRAFSFGSTCTVSNVHRIWSRLWSFQVQNAFLVAVAEGGEERLCGPAHRDAVGHRCVWRTADALDRSAAQSCHGALGTPIFPSLADLVAHLS